MIVKEVSGRSLPARKHREACIMSGHAPCAGRAVPDARPRPVPNGTHRIGRRHRVACHEKRRQEWSRRLLPVRAVAAGVIFAP
ncbi:hypothetical protein NJLHNGOC_08940 [Novacetimonas cocois]|uniref:Uncharacterized protein n=1 Tax=Novacetimonas cocois TaxID=1747507 RepID=A0A365YWV8_9PROT|nr:hypothetical protein NJLHNGOC_08940 [Novacetimonas cocois]